MTENKPIIIDGVDVSECEYYQYDMCTATKDNYGDCSSYCKDYDMKNCYFKQLARKTRECEQKDKEIDELHLIIDRLLDASGYDKNTSTAEDFEDVYENMQYEQGLLDQLKAENEKYKKNKELYEQRLKTTEKVKNQFLYERNYAEQKLQKIEAKCNETLELMNKDSGTNAYVGGRCIEAGNILKIIDEVE